MLDTLTFVAIALALAFILGEIFFKLKYPRLIGQIIAGIILGMPFIMKQVTSEAIAATSNLAEFGIIFLLLLTGLKIDLKRLKKSEVNSVVIALFCTLVPFFLGFLLMKYLGFSTLISFVVGGCLSITAEAANLDILLEMKALNTRVGTIIMGAGILDDLFGTLFLSFVLLFAHKAGLILFPLNLVIFIIIAYITFKLFPGVVSIISRDRSIVSSFSTIVIFGIVISVLSAKLGLSSVLGALLAGIIIRLVEQKRKEFKEIVKDLKIIALGFIVPFFFIKIGMFLKFQYILSHWSLVILVVLFATFGKVFGAILATPFTNLRLAQTHLIGWGMNSRGAIELVIAEIARSNGLIPMELYVAIVSMAVITTMIFPFVMRNAIKDDRRILR